MRNALAGAVLIAFLGACVTVVAEAADDDSPSPAPVASSVPSVSASTAATGADTASPAPQQDDTSAASRAKEWLGRLQKGQLDRAQLTPDLSAGLQDATVQALSKQLSPLGAPQRIVLRTKRQVAGNTTWTFRVSWPDQTLDYTFGVEDLTGKISALYLRPGSPA